MDTDEKRWEICKEMRTADSERGACIGPIQELRRQLNNVSILGSVYTIQVIQNVDKYPMLKDSLGYVDFSIRTIFVKYPEYDVKNMANLKEVLHTIIRHEIIHAFLHESGLDNCSNLYEAGWATNEEMVDFFAIQLPKIQEACIAAGIVAGDRYNAAGKITYGCDTKTVANELSEYYMLDIESSKYIRKLLEYGDATKQTLVVSTYTQDDVKFVRVRFRYSGDGFGTGTSLESACALYYAQFTAKSSEENTDELL